VDLLDITTVEIKNYLKLEDLTANEEVLIDAIAKASIGFCETKLNRPILDANMNETNTWTVAEEVRIAVYLVASHWHENRSPVGQVTQEVDFTVNAILQPHRFRNV
jgi:hypothetical protein